MKIVDIMKKRDVDIRITCNYRWLIYAPLTKKWLVYERKPYQKMTRTIVKTSDEALAVHHLISQG